MHYYIHGCVCRGSEAKTVQVEDKSLAEVRKLGHRPVTKNTGYSVYKQTLSKHCFTNS